MEKSPFIIGIITILLILTGCANIPPTQMPLSDTDKIATIVATLSVILTPMPNATATVTPEIPTPTPVNTNITLSATHPITLMPNATATVAPEIPTLRPINANIQTYTDPDLGFKLQYDLSWQFDAKPGTGMWYNDGKGRTIEISKNGYIFQLIVVDGPGDVEGCAGLLQENPSKYRVYKIDDVELWRIKAEQGYINSYSDDNISNIQIISPLTLNKQPDSAGYWGKYTCEPQISNHSVSIFYQLPFSETEIKAGKVKPDILAEMDHILISLTWR
jgi:hypothetical protein